VDVLWDDDQFGIPVEEAAPTQHLDWLGRLIFLWRRTLRNVVGFLRQIIKLETVVIWAHESHPPPKFILSGLRWLSLICDAAKTFANGIQKFWHQKAAHSPF
jgi:hypothetical protein